jgi:hypothetical protein
LQFANNFTLLSVNITWNLLKYVWTKILVSDTFNLLAADLIFLRAATTKLSTVISLEQTLNTREYRVIMLDDLNAHNYDWINGTSLSNSISL